MNAHDRCDRCRAQAYVTYQRIVSVADTVTFYGTTLMFCGHHSREYEPQLMAQGFVIIHQDEINPATPEELTNA